MRGVGFFIAYTVGDIPSRLSCLVISEDEAKAARIRR
jgi:hypothetical protein